MEFIEILHEVEEIFNQIEEQHSKLTINEEKINFYIEKLLLIIEQDNFNSVEAYNYCKILKELMIKKRATKDIRLIYQRLMKVSSSTSIRKKLCKKEKRIAQKQYTSRIFNNEEAIVDYLNQDKEIL